MIVSFLTAPRTASQKRDLDLIFEVGALFGLRFLHGRSRGAPAKKLAEQIAEIRAARAAKVESAKVEMLITAGFFGRGGPAALGVKAKLVVHLAFLGVGENVVRLLHLLELFFGGFIAGIQVGMILAGQFTIGLPYLLLGGLAGDAQQLVIILFGGSCHGLV